MSNPNWTCFLKESTNKPYLLITLIERPGDANWDTKVNYLDLGILATNYDSSGKTWDDGDFTKDGTVNYEDLGILATHYGEGTGAGAVPEPGVLCLLALGALAIRRRRA